MLLFSCCLSFAANGQGSETPSASQALDSIPLLKRTDSLGMKTKALPSQVTTRTDSVSARITAPVDSVDTKLSALKISLQQRLDSLKAKGQPSEALQKRLDSLNNLSQLPGDQYNKLLSLKQQLKDSISARVPGLASVNNVSDKTKSAVGEVNQVSTELGIGPLGKDLKPDINAKLPETGVDLSGLPGSPGVNAEVPKLNTEIPAVGTDVKQKIPSVKGNNLNGLVPEEVGDIKDKIGTVSSTLNEAGTIMKEGEGYVKEVKTIQEEGLGRSEKIPELAEQQLMKIDEVAALQNERAASLGQMEEYKKLIEQYKEEKAIKADLEKRSREIANDAIIQNQAKVDASMNKLSKAKRKLSSAKEFSNLAQRAPNPMKGLSWRERVVPGFILYTFATDRVWLQLDPQINYKLNGNLSLGAGAMYRFSMNPGNITFRDFKSLYGTKVFAQYHAYKGFWLRAEGQHERWKPWHFQHKDPSYIDEVFVAAAGICKNYSVGKRIKGNAQTLYHFTWGEFDPYKPKIILRIGFDLSIVKKEVKPWEKKLKEIKKSNKKINHL